jgi:hypothetical protein
MVLGSARWKLPNGEHGGGKCVLRAWCWVLPDGLLAGKLSSGSGSGSGSWKWLNPWN